MKGIGTLSQTKSGRVGSAFTTVENGFNYTGSLNFVARFHTLVVAYLWTCALVHNDTFS